MKPENLKTKANSKYTSKYCNNTQITSKFKERLIYIKM